MKGKFKYLLNDFDILVMDKTSEELFIVADNGEISHKIEDVDISSKIKATSSVVSAERACEILGCSSIVS